ncbi:hypothetical protein U9M48_037267 [Paspalum notatum var. saurae]|uniref:Uncharacterized protein n=1 Tax=Paspalum notatum var. saurae TaxID=547442 RepID=A0AAQ3UKU7_PASNO
MHRAWNACPHAGSRRTVSPSRTAPMHTAHSSSSSSSSSSSPSPSRRRRRYSNAGMASITAHRAGGVRAEPAVDAPCVERVPARRQPPHRLPVPHRALHLLPFPAAAMVLERRDGLDVLLAEATSSATDHLLLQLPWLMMVRTRRRVRCRDDVDVVAREHEAERQERPGRRRRSPRGGRRRRTRRRDPDL